MIPKVIHYCWFGGKELPELANKCIESWKKYLPDYEIRRWDESNFDVNIIPYCEEAYKSKKYAFVSDYARFWILYKYGGLYFDTDVEVIRPIDDIIMTGAFMGCENESAPDAPATSLGVNPGLGIGAEAGTDIYKDILDSYADRHFINSDGSMNVKTIVEYTSELLSERGLVNSYEIQDVDGIRIYPKDYFCPIDYETKELIITDNTRSIHHYAESWLPLKAKIFNLSKKIFGKKFSKKCSAIYNKLF